MPLRAANGVQLFVELSGDGESSIVLVHGSWSSHHGWDQVVPSLEDSFRVLTYDRRGHSESERPAGQGSIREDVADLGALIEDLGLAPAWVVGNSFGASIALRLVGARPDLIRGLICHEPPLLAALGDDPAFEPVVHQVAEKVGTIAEQIAQGDHRGGAKQFVEDVALGPGSWEQLPPEVHDTLVENAPTFLDEANDPDQLIFDADWLEGFAKPILLTMGTESPPMFGPIIAKVAEAAPHAEVVTLKGTGHIPHITHSEPYTETILSFIRENSG
jgi:pimeloyl-ACP methyl ester carboxylesterase